VLSFRLLPSATADETCLRIAIPEINSDQQKIDLYRQVMKDEGLCVTPVAMPQIRAVAALRSGRVDGVLAAGDNLPELAHLPLISGDVLIASLAGYLVVREGPVNGLADLTTEVVGVPLGATWCTKLVEQYANVVRAPRGTAMLKEMLVEGRIDAMLVDGYSLDLSGGVPDGYKAIVVDQFDVHSWLKAEFVEYKAQFDRGTSAYLAALGH
jgi:ABC-type amino acid transport substrate-binding protein